MNASRIIKIDHNTWARIKQNVLKDRDSFEEAIGHLIFDNCPKQIIDTEIHFPETLTKPDRYKIHIYTQRDLIYGKSFDKSDDERYIVTYLSKRYTQYLFECGYYEVKPVEEEISPLDQFKNDAFNKLIKFLNENFKSEFEKYLGNI